MRWSGVAIGSLVYGVVIMSVGLTLGVLRTMYPKDSKREKVSNYYSYYRNIVALLFLLEVELARLYERHWWPKRHQNGLAYCHVGSFYLRLGVLVFGSAAIIRHCMHFYLEYAVYDANWWEWAKEPIIAAYYVLLMAITFNFTITRMPMQSAIECFGFMHVFAVNFTKWVRSAIDEKNHLSGGHHHSTQNEQDVDQDVFGEYSAVIGAFNTEFLIASAGMLVIVWLNLTEIMPQDARWRQAVVGRDIRKKTVRITIGRTFLGLFLGLGLSIFLSVGVLIHSYYKENGLGKAKWVMEVTNAGAYASLLLGCLVGLYLMRQSVDGKWDMSTMGRKDEVLDKTLLLVGLAAEVLYCGTAVVGAIHTIELKHKISATVGFILRLAQVVLQAHLIMDLEAVVQHKKELGEHTPGRQSILFLLWSNLALFVYYCVQTIHSIFDTTVIGTMPDPYRPIIALALPFVLFYRFHSSAMLAELYKHHCSEKKHGESVNEHGGGPGGGGVGGGVRNGVHGGDQVWPGNSVRNIPIRMEHERR